MPGLPRGRATALGSSAVFAMLLGSAGAFARGGTFPEPPVLAPSCARPTAGGPAPVSAAISTQEWPDEPWPRGAVLLAPGPCENPEVRVQFLDGLGPQAEDAGEEAPSGGLVVLHTGGRDRFRDAAIAARADAHFELGTEVHEAQGAEMLKALCSAQALWIDGEHPDRLGLPEVRSALTGMLPALLEGGGRVGAGGRCAVALGSSYFDGFARREGLGLLPRSVVESVPELSGPAERMHQTLRERRGLVGLRIAEGGAVLLSGRRLRALGGASSCLHLPSGPGLERRAQTLDPGPSRRRDMQRRAVADWTAWRRDAVERGRDDHPGLDPGLPNVEHGTLVIVGGGGMPRGLFEDMVEWAGGAQSSFVYVPCSEERVIEDEPGSVQALRNAGAGEATWIHTKAREAADHDERILGPLREATGLWFGGGRQWNFVDSYHGTKAHQLMLEVLARGGVIGGSSAGASIQGRYLARADPLGNLNILAPGYERGLGFLDGVSIDQHFRQRNRFGDMSGLMEVYPELLGIGIDEGTALIVRGTIGDVRGRGQVHFYTRDEPVAEGAKDHVSVGDGGRYELLERRVLEWGEGGDGAR